VRVLLIEEGLPIDKEFYLGIVLDRASGRSVFMARQPAAWISKKSQRKRRSRFSKRLSILLSDFVRFKRASSRLRWVLTRPWFRQATKFMQSLYTAYESMDASLMEDQSVSADERQSSDRFWMRR